MKFLIDAQLPPALAHWLRKIGHDARHVNEIGLISADDRVIREHVAREGLVLISKDRDFAPVNVDDRRDIRVIWVRTGNLSARALIDQIDRAWPRIMQHIQEGAQLVELR